MALPVKLTVFPEAYHDFDYPDAGIYGTALFRPLAAL